MTYTVNSGNYTPILYSSAENLDDRIDTFKQYYDGTVSFVTSDQVEDIVGVSAGHSTEIVLSQDKAEAILIASAISAKLKAPLFIGHISEEYLDQPNLKEVISVGDNPTPCECEIIALATIDRALQYYNQLVMNSDAVVFVDDTKNAMIAAELAVFHEAKIALERDEAKGTHAKNLIWSFAEKIMKTKSSMIENTTEVQGKKVLFLEHWLLQV